MDYFAHGFWSYIFFHYLKRPYLAVLFGLLPDTLSWGIYLFYNLFNGGLKFNQPDLHVIPDWVFTLYGISHSLFLAGIIILIIYLIMRKVPPYIYAWPIAILMDIPTHSREFLPTPFLWPLSNWYFPGFSWGNYTFMIIDYVLIISLLIYISFKKNKDKIKCKKSIKKDK